MRALRVVDDFFVTAALQEAALEFVTSPAFGRHLRALRAALRDRRDALVTAVRTHVGADAVPYVPRGGFFVWVKLPEGIDDQRVARAALDVGVAGSAASP